MSHVAAPVAADTDGTGLPVVEMSGVSKSFGAVHALQDVDLVLHDRRVHALIGENGAGKSTLMNVLMGIYRPDAGQVRFLGEDVDIRSPRDASDLGVGMVHQHFELIQAFSGIENIALAVEKDLLLRRREAVRPIVHDLMERYGLTVDLERRVADLEVGDQQKVELLRVLAQGARVLLLDEPTTHLAPAEVDRLFAAVRGLASDGVAVVLITHKVREILSLADEITVLRQGRRVAALEGADATADSLVGLVMGVGADEAAPAATDGATDAMDATDAADGPPPEPTLGNGDREGDTTAPTPLALTGVATSATRGEVALDVESLRVGTGEIVGVAAVAGNGQRDLVETLAGLRRPRTGTVELHGRDVTRHSVASRIRHGLAVLPGDRIREGILPSSPLYETYALGLHHFVPRYRWRIGELRSRAPATRSAGSASPPRTRPRRRATSRAATSRRCSSRGRCASPGTRRSSSSSP